MVVNHVANKLTYSSSKICVGQRLQYGIPLQTEVFM